MSEARTPEHSADHPAQTGATLTREQILRKVTLFDYALHIASPFTLFLLSVVAVIINYVKRPDSVGTIYHSHMEWMLSTFWWGIFWMVVTGGLGLISFGLLQWTMVIPLVWYLYRMIKGLIRAMEDRAIE